MHVEFRKAVVPDEIRALLRFDAKVFSSLDRFPASAWREFESYWMMVEGKTVGCCAFAPNTDFTEDVRDDGENLALAKSLYIASTAILPAFHGRGFGQLLKAWQIAYARHHGFRRIVTNTRKRNRPMIALNRKFGFQVIRTSPRYYSEPTDATVVMELRLPTKRVR